jgi:hypothetical protein
MTQEEFVQSLRLADVAEGTSQCAGLSDDGVLAAFAICTDCGGSRPPALLSVALATCPQSHVVVNFLHMAHCCACVQGACPCGGYWLPPGPSAPSDEDACWQGVRDFFGAHVLHDEAAERKEKIRCR